MGYTVSSIRARILTRLNDTSQQIYTDTVLLPFIQDSADELQAMLDLYGILVLEHVTSPPIIVPQLQNYVPGTRVSMKSLGLLPNDMLEPQRMSERLSGTTDLFMPMIPRQWEPDILLTDALRYWVYREEDIFLVGANTNRDVLIYYKKRLLIVNDMNSVIGVNNSTMFMINRTAGFAARNIGENTTRADNLDKEAEANMSWILRIGTKDKQRARTRRRPFILTGRRRWV